MSPDAQDIDYAIDKLCEALGLDRNKPGWREKLAPFAPVLAAMISNEGRAAIGRAIGSLDEAIDCIGGSLESIAKDASNLNMVGE